VQVATAGVPRLMNITLFFDLDGPLLDVSARYATLHADLLKAAGLRGMAADQYWERKRARVPEEEILRELGVLGLAPNYLRERLDRVESLEYLLLDRPWPWTHEVLGRLARRYPLVLVTARSSRLLLLEQLDRLDLIAFFHEVLSEPARRGVDKQKARLISDYLRRHERPADGWMVGDTEADVSAGQLVGLRTAAVLTGIRNADLLQAVSPDHLFKDIRELPAQLEPAPVSGGVAEGETS
jgi:phosphoglycolate phosphatase